MFDINDTRCVEINCNRLSRFDVIFVRYDVATFRICSRRKRGTLGSPSVRVCVYVRVSKRHLLRSPNRARMSKSRSDESIG